MSKQQVVERESSLLGMVQYERRGQLGRCVCQDGCVAPVGQGLHGALHPLRAHVRNSPGRPTCLVYMAVAGVLAVKGKLEEQILQKTLGRSSEVKGEPGAYGPCEKEAEGPSVDLASRVPHLHMDTCRPGQVLNGKAQQDG